MFAVDSCHSSIYHSLCIFKRHASDYNQCIGNEFINNWQNSDIIKQHFHMDGKVQFCNLAQRLTHFTNLNPSHDTTIHLKNTPENT